MSTNILFTPVDETQLGLSHGIAEVIGNTISHTQITVEPVEEHEFRIPAMVQSWLDEFRRDVAYTLTGVQSNVIIDRYTRVSDYIMSHPVLTNDEKMLMFHIMANANDAELDSGLDVEVDILQHELISLMGVSKNTFLKALGNLEKFGLVSLIKSDNQNVSKELPRRTYVLHAGPWPMLGDLPNVMPNWESAKITMHTWISNFSDRSIAQGWRKIVLSENLTLDNVLDYLIRYLADKKTFFTHKIKGNIDDYITMLNKNIVDSNFELIRSKLDLVPVAQTNAFGEGLSSEFEPTNLLPVYGKLAPTQGNGHKFKLDFGNSLSIDIYRLSFMSIDTRLLRNIRQKILSGTGDERMPSERVLDVIAKQMNRKPKNKRSDAEEVVKAYTTAVQKKDPEFKLAYSAKKILGIINNVLRSNSVDDVCRAVSWLVDNWEGYKPKAWSGDDQIPDIQTILSGHFLTKGMNDSRRGIKPKTTTTWTDVTNEQVQAQKASEDTEHTKSLEREFLRRQELLKAKKGM